MEAKDVLSCVVVAFLAGAGGSLSKFAFEEQEQPSPLILRALALAGALTCNASQLSVFVSIMQNIGASKATLTVKAMECVITGLFGALLFGEHLSIHWLFGVASILIGLRLLLLDSDQKPDSKAKIKKQE